MPPIRFDPGRALLMAVDLQEKLLPAIEGGDGVVRRTEILIRALRQLAIPIVWTEQYRKGLGETVAPIREAIGEAARPIEKMTFGCLACGAVREAARQSGRDQLVIVGIETHVCVLQTALQALEEGWTVFLAEDATGSRRREDRETALRRLTQAGVVPATVEMLIMEALHEAGTPDFKSILPLLKGS